MWGMVRWVGRGRLAPWWVGPGRALGQDPELILTSALPSLPGSAEPPAICEISPLVSYAGEVRADRPAGAPLGLGWRGWTGQVELDAWLGSHSSATVNWQGQWSLSGRGLSKIWGAASCQKPGGVGEGKAGPSEPGVWASGSLSVRGQPALPPVGSSGNLLFSHSVVSKSMQSCGLQHARLPCPSLSP